MNDQVMNQQSGKLIVIQSVSNDIAPPATNSSVNYNGFDPQAQRAKVSPLYI